MTEKAPFEIPESMRDFAEKSVAQAKEAYDQLIEANQKAQETLAQSSAAMSGSAKDIQDKAVQIAESNLKSGFDLAEKLIKAKDAQEAFEIQATYARQQMSAYSEQAQELSELLSKAAAKTKPE